MRAVGRVATLTALILHELKTSLGLDVSNLTPSSPVMIIIHNQSVSSMNTAIDIFHVIPRSPARSFGSMGILESRIWRFRSIPLSVETFLRFHVSLGDDLRNMVVRQLVCLLVVGIPLLSPILSDQPLYRGLTHAGTFCRSDTICTSLPSLSVPPVPSCSLPMPEFQQRGNLLVHFRSVEYHLSR